MSTALDIINDALDDLTIKSSEVSLTDSEVSSAIRKMNRMLTNWAQGGLNLGFTKIENSSDTLTTPDWADELITAQLAIRLASSFGMQVSPEIVAIASDSMTRALRNNIQLSKPSYPGSLPTGSGNYNNGSNSHFFNDSSDGDLQTNTKANIDSDTGDQLSVD